MPATRNITIVRGNLTTGKLELTESGNPALHVYVNAGDKINWHIKSGSNVSVVVMISGKDGANPIFSTSPQPQGNHWTAEVEADPDDFAIYDYYIQWRTTSDTITRTFDPLLAVRPTEPIIKGQGHKDGIDLGDLLSPFLALLIGAALVLLGVQFGFRKGRAKN